MNKETPFPHLESERLILRPVSIGDAEPIFKYRSDKMANKYQGWIPEKLSDVHEFIEHRVSSELNLPDTWFQFGMIRKETLEFIGDLGIHFLPGDAFQVELGITIDQAYQGKGYATEGMREVMNFLFSRLNKHRITASIDPRNEQSIKLVERLGFRKEAYFRKSLLIDGIWSDDLVYAILEEEWNSVAGVNQNLF
jgi:RimJ/RimL family protein N-acetyltransferase